jgi:hypothetical protein
VPSILVECGFISNPGELALLKQPTFQQREAMAIAIGLLALWSQNAPLSSGRRSDPVTLHRLSRQVMAVVLVMFLVGTISILTAAPAHAAEGDIPPAVPAIDPTTMVVALTMATVEALSGMPSSLPI